jgi:hypothetical protein
VADEAEDKTKDEMEDEAENEGEGEDVDWYARTFGSVTSSGGGVFALFWC